MRFTVDAGDGDEEEPMRSPSGATPTPKEEVQWFPLQAHPLFTPSSAAAIESFASQGKKNSMSNLMAWDGSSRLYVWDARQQCLHRISVRLGEPEEHSVIAASPSKVLRPDRGLKFTVHRISVNKNGSAALLSGSDGLGVMYLCGRSSAKDVSITCRTVFVGPEIYLHGNKSVRVLQAAWHPYSDSHVGVLSSDSVFRIFDLSCAPWKPEQEYYLQHVAPGRARKASSLCPVSFSFGCDHLWDRFSVFILFSDGTVYVLCPVAPFGSVFLWDSVMEIYSDARAFGSKSGYATAIKNSSLAISWLEATFPALKQQGEQGGIPAAVKAHAYALVDASLLMQGPLGKVCQSGEDPDAHAAECEGRVVNFLYNSIGKDSVLVTAWSGGQLQVDALADEIQPLWNTNNPPRLCVDPHNRILSFAMICEAISEQFSFITLDQSSDHTDWLGQPPPLLRLAIVDLALPKNSESDPMIYLYPDPLIPERIYIVHGGGVDSIVLHFLPFTTQSNGKGDSMKTPPSVYPVICTNQEEDSIPSSSYTICGFVILSDSFGYSWIAGITSTQECIVLEMKTWNVLLPFLVDMKKSPFDSEEPLERDRPNIISKELVDGPNAVIIPHGSPSMRHTVDSIEGRSVLHQYSRLFHENYVEYGHKVQFELKYHGPHAKKIVDSLKVRASKVREKLLGAEEKRSKLTERIERAVQVHSTLEERLQRLRKLPGVHKKPLSRAERKFKAELDTYRDVELDALRSTIDALNARVRRYAQQRWSNESTPERHLQKYNVSESQLTPIRAALEKLSIVNSENVKKVQLVESKLGTIELEDSTGN